MAGTLLIFMGFGVLIHERLYLEYEEYKDHYRDKHGNDRTPKNRI